MYYDKKNLREAKKLCKKLKKNISRLLIADIKQAIHIKSGFAESESLLPSVLFPKETFVFLKRLIDDYNGLQDKLRRDIRDITLLLNDILSVTEYDYKITTQELETVVKGYETN
ncbi:MAG: hypothetical protein K2N22_05980 [Clostridia bacterium]|nr:hypothetical protein [Clostridia bacterium]